MLTRTQSNWNSHTAAEKWTGTTTWETHIYTHRALQFHFQVYTQPETCFLKAADKNVCGSTVVRASSWKRSKHQSTEEKTWRSTQAAMRIKPLLYAAGWRRVLQCWVTEDGHRRIHIKWLCSHKIQMQTRLSVPQGRQARSCLGTPHLLPCCCSSPSLSLRPNVACVEASSSVSHLRGALSVSFRTMTTSCNYTRLSTA